MHKARRRSAAVRSSTALGLVFSCLAYLSGTSASAAEAEGGAQPSYNFYGQTGMLDMPDANFQPDGELSFSVSASPTEQRYTINFQALPWLETDFRYSHILNEFQGYDRSLSFKIRLSQEDRYFPQVAVGVEDVLGTGIFGAEYLVASKRIGDFDLTGGLGWGRLSSFASFKNPFSLVSSGFLDRSTNELGGSFSTKSLLHGPHAGLFGGITWQSPIEGLKLIAELSGDHYIRERADGSINVKSQINLGISYEPWRGFQVGAGYLYGSVFGARITIHLNPFDDPPKVKLGTPPPDVNLREPEARNEAVLDLLQNTTHYYDNWPGAEPVKSTGTSEKQNSVSIADALFSEKITPGTQIRDVETYGRTLILELSAAQRHVSCANVLLITQRASAAGFSEIAVSVSSNPEAVQICPTMPTSASPTVQRANWIAGSGKTLSDLGPSEAIAENAPAKDKGASAQDASTMENTSPQSELQASQARITVDAVAQSLNVQAISISNDRVEIAFANQTYQTQTEAIGRLLRILMADTPNSVEQFRIVEMIGYMPTLALTFHRSDLERNFGLSASAPELLPTTDIFAVPEDDPLVRDFSKVSFPAYGFSIAPGYHQGLFDPKLPYQFGIYAALNGTVALTRELTIQGTFEANIYNDFSASRPSNSLLPHVRSDFTLYQKHGENGIANLNLGYLTKLNSDVYLYARAGYLEDMYAGFGGEVYWRPPHKRWSVGAALYAVQQRDFNRLFGLRNYHVITGHVSFYYNSPVQNLDFIVHAGRYLAGDYGATFEVLRRFDSGITVGGYVTFTNVPFSTFGEGSFDKGIIIHIPVGTVAPVNSQSQASLDFSPLTRDGGQRLEGEQTLYGITETSSEGDLLKNWDNVIHP